MWYTTKVGPDVANTARELVVHMSHPGPENWKALGHLIGYLKGKETKGIIIRKPKVLKAVMTCFSPRRPLFLHVVSFECTTKLCINFINQFSAYFHI